jgi:hypothetical protein
MATNYTFERGKYGVFPGTIIAFPRTLEGNDPNGTDFRNKIPAGFLRCDGSVLNGDDYPNLTDILGVGSASKFKKENITIQNNQFQLPDLGSKYIQANASSGVYTGDTVEVDEDKFQQKVGVATDITLNRGSELEMPYSGDISVPSQPIPFLSTQNFGTTMGVVFDEINVNDSSYLMHGHYSNLPVWAFSNSENYSTSMSVGSADPSPFLTSINSVPIIGAITQVAGETANATHLHTVDRQFPTKNITAQTPAFTADGFNIVTEVKLVEKDTKKMDDLVPRYILVEFLIKY